MAHQCKAEAAAGVGRDRGCVVHGSPDVQHDVELLPKSCFFLELTDTKASTSICTLQGQIPGYIAVWHISSSI